MRLVEQNGGLGKIQVSDEHNKTLRKLIKCKKDYLDTEIRKMLASLFPSFRLEDALSILFHETYMVIKT